MKDQDEPPDILNSKIKKIRIELPHYAFSHSSSGDSHHDFIGRERIRERLKKVIEDSPDEPGVYLIAGNRGVGKTSYVNEVIKETSLQPKSVFTENLKYVFLLFLAVAGTQFCLHAFDIIENHPKILKVTSLLMFALSFILLCYFNSYRRKFSKPKHGHLEKILNCVKTVFNGITSAFIELSYLINPYNPYGKIQCLLKIILVISFTEFICITNYKIANPAIIFAGYLIIFLIFMLFRFVRCKFHKNKLKNKNEILSKYNNYFLLKLKYIFLIPINNYIKNNNRLYLRINFGHKLKDEKDILRLIARTLNTEYNKYHRSFRRMLPRRIIAFGFLLIISFLFSPIIEKQEFYNKLIKDKELYKVSSQILLNDFITLEDSSCLKKLSNYIYLKKTHKYSIFLNMKNKEHTKKINSIYIIKDRERLEGVFSNIDNLKFTDVIKTREDSTNKILNKSTIIKYKVDINVNNKIGNVGKFFLVLDQLVYEITKIVKNFYNFHFANTKINDFVLPISYLFWLSFFLMYIFCKLLFRYTWITHFFTTHQIIMRRIKKLNSDITHSTERENSINVNSGSVGIGTRTKKSRDVADAREIEKELQDILSDMQRIPVIMCRPNIVIVFDELDKVEPGDTGSEKENIQTKASLFSIHAARERQTEILRILSNMKYFLSTARAKFIFIAGREMFDIHLADVSERNNYIGSIFNAVILVPSFLTDHHTGKDFLPMESSIASLPEEFVCRKLIPYDYSVESYDLKNYREYLEIEMLCGTTQKIKNIILSVEKKEIKQICKIACGKNVKREQIKKIIIEKNKEIIKKIKHIIISVEKDEIMQKIEKIIANINNGAIKQICKTIENDQIKIIILTKNNEKLGRKIIDDIRYEEEKIEKIIAVLQQFIIYLAHLSKGAPKKMTQLFESFIEIRNDRDKNREDDFLVVQRYHGSRHFLSFNYYKQYTLGIVAYLITPIFYRLAESNIKEHSDKLLVSSLRFVDFLFKFHKYSFSWKILDISPEMLEVDRAPELKSIAVELLNYLAQIHISKSNFNLYDYKFDSWIANEIFAMAKTDDLFSALFSFSLDEMLPLKKHYLDLLEKTEKEYRYDKDDKTSVKYIDAVSSLEIVLGDLCYYNDELEEAGVHYKNAVEMIRKNDKISSDRLYLYVRNKLKLGMIHEKRKQYDFAYWTYGELCKQIIQEREKVTSTLRPVNLKNILPCCYDMSFEKMAYEGLKMLYLPFIAKLQILEKSHVDGITYNKLKQLDDEFKLLTSVINHEESSLIEAEFYSRIADILYYKNYDLKCKKNKNRRDDKYENDINCDNKNTKNNNKKYKQNYSCTACYYYHKSLLILLNISECNEPGNKDINTVKKLLTSSIKQIKNNYNVKYCMILARILSNWGNVFFSCDDIHKKNEKCYICDEKKRNTVIKNNTYDFLKNYIKHLKSETENESFISLGQLKSKNNIAFAMYSISSEAYCKANLYKRSSYQIYKMLCLFKHYKIYGNKKSNNYIKRLSEKAIHYLWYTNDDLNVLELNKRKKDLGNELINKKIPLQNLLVDSEITKIRILVKELELKSNNSPKNLKKYYDMRITSPYKINYSIGARIYRLWLKSKVNYKSYKQLLKNSGTAGDIQSGIEYILENDKCNNTMKAIFGDYFNFNDEKNAKIKVLENLIAESIYCLIDIAQLTETMDETFVFTHSFLGLIHKRLSYWIRLYETYEKVFFEKYKYVSRIKEYLKKYLDEEWREQLSGYRENQRALSHYYKSLEMHSGGRAYHNMIDTMYYLRDDFNDRSDHFNIAEERHLIVNGKIDKKIKAIKYLYKKSKLYKVDNY